MSRPRFTLSNPAWLALASVTYNRRLSLFTVIIYAAIVAPVFVLYLLKTGVISAWSDDLSQDVQSREIDIKGEYITRLVPSELERLRALPGVDFVVGEAMALVSTRQMRRVEPTRGPTREIKVRTTAQGDPLLSDGLTVAPTEVVLSAQAASRLGANVGDRLAFTLRRQLVSGQTETHRIAFDVVHIIDARKWPSEAVFVLSSVAVAMSHWIEKSLEDFNAIQSTKLDSTERFASFRIYARSVHEATALKNRLVADNYDATLRVADVSRMKFLEHGLNLVFGVLMAMSVIGLTASILLFQWLSVERQKQDLALLLTAGYDRLLIRAFVFGQALILSGLGLVMAVGIAGIAFRGLGPVVLRQVDLATDALNWPTVAFSLLSLGVIWFIFAGLAWFAVGRLPMATLVAALRSD